MERHSLPSSPSFVLLFLVLFCLSLAFSCSSSPRVRVGVGCLFSSSVLFFTFDRYQLAWSFPCRAQGCGRLGSIRSTACCSDCCVARGEQLATDGVPFLIIK